MSWRGAPTIVKFKFREGIPQEKLINDMHQMYKVNKDRNYINMMKHLG